MTCLFCPQKISMGDDNTDVEKNTSRRIEFNINEVVFIRAAFKPWEMNLIFVSLG
jgi:UPF0288 family protein (methanogenesis marker protein 3)